MEQIQKLGDADLPPLREEILAQKSSRPTRILRACLNVSGNNRLPVLSWDVLTLPARSIILVELQQTSPKAETKKILIDPRRSIAKLDRPWRSFLFWALVLSRERGSDISFRHTPHLVASIEVTIKGAVFLINS